MVVENGIPIELDGELGGLEPFSVLDDLASRARVAFIGEMDHFIAEKYDYRLLCIRYLASRGWRWFGEEWAAGRGRRVDAYLRTGDESLLEPEDEAPWFTKGLLSNDRQPTAALEAAQAQFYRTVRRVVPNVRWFGFDTDRDPEYIELANAADTYEALRPAMALRETIMHRQVAQVLADNPVDKVALLAAAQHLLKDDYGVAGPDGGAGPGGDTERSIGHFTAQELTDAPVLSFWFLHGEGTSDNPWLGPHGRLAPQPGTVDAELGARVTGACLVPIGDDRHLRTVTGMHNTVIACKLSDQVDALVFAPKVHPLSGSKWS